MNTDAITIEYGSGTLTAEDFVDDGFILEENLCSASQIACGACEAAAVEVRIASTAASFVGKTLTVKLGANALGKYKVVSDERAYDGETRILKAYDALYDVNGQDVSAWYESIDWNVITTLKQFRDSFFRYLGITQATADLVNDEMPVKKTMEASSCSGATILQAICEVNGVFGHINANGHFQYVSLSNGEPTVVNADEVLDSLTEDFTVPAFDGVLIRTEEGDIGGQYPASGAQNQYIITGNFLCYGKTTAELQSIAQNALSKIGGKTYVPFEADLECQGNIALGGKVTIPTEPATFTSYVLQRKLVGFEDLEEYFVAQGSPEYVPDVNSARNQMVATDQRINKLTTTLNGTVSEVSAIKGNYVTKGTLEETEKHFVAQFEEVDKEIQQLTEELDGNINFYNVTEDISDKAKHPIERTYPSYNWTYNVVCGKSVCSVNTKFEYTTEGWRKNLRSLAFNEETSESYRFVKENDEFLWKTVSDTDFGVAMARIASLEVSTEKIETDVKAQDAIITAQGTRITTAETNITQTSNAIKEEVKRAGDAEADIRGSLELKIDLDDNDQIVSMLNASANQINLTGNRVVINSDNFKVSRDGSVTATNANITGKIKSSEAEITGGSFAVGGKFAVDQDGTMRASGATIDGTLTSSNATITGGSLKVGNSFEVNTSGTLKATNADISGKITSGNIAVTGGTLDIGNGNFSVNSSGNVTAQNIKVTGGEIDLNNGTFKVDSHGVLTAKDANIKGTIESSNAKITGGSIQIVTAETSAANFINLSNNVAGRNSSLSISPQKIVYYDEYTKLKTATRVYVDGNNEYSSVISIDSIDTAASDIIASTEISPGRIELDGKRVLTTEDTDWTRQILSAASGATKTVSVDGYKTLVLTGQLYGGGARQTVTIPLSQLSTSNLTYAITGISGSAIAQLTARMSVNNGTLTIYTSGSNLGTGAMWLFADLQK